MQPFNQYFAGNDGDALEISNLSTFHYPEYWFYDALTGGHRSDSGVAVNGYTALTWCPLWQGVNIIAGDLGQVPFWVMHDDFDEQREHPVWHLLNRRPNELQTPSVFLETMWQWMLIWGNAVAYIPRVGSRVTDMIPLRPDCVWPELFDFDVGQRLIYHYWSHTANKEYIFLPDEVLHIQGLTSDGIWGYPLWQVAKNTIGGGLAVDKHGNKSFANSARPSGVLKFPGKLQPDARANLRREWEQLHSGADNAGRVAILVDGAEFQAMAQTNVESQFAEIRKLTAVEAACLLNLPAYKLNVQDSMGTKSNLEEQNETYKQMTLTRPANRFCQEAERKLLPHSQWMSGRFRIVPQWDKFLDADIDTKTQVADRLTKATIWNPNEARAYLGYAPREGGDEYGNPATSSSGLQPEDGQESPDNGRPPGAETENRTPEHLASVIQSAVSREGEALVSAARTKKNFVGWLDAFYGKSRRSGVVADIIDRLLSQSDYEQPEKAKAKRSFMQWARKRRTEVLDLCDTVTGPELESAVAQYVEANKNVIIDLNTWRIDKWD